MNFYAYHALATDRYPPFSLASTDCPADLTVDDPERLSRGLVLVKWGPLAIPHYLIVSLLQGAVGYRIGGGLTGILVLVAGVALLFTGRYPRDLFDLVMGLDPWACRVAAYALSPDGTSTRLPAWTCASRTMPSAVSDRKAGTAGVRGVS